MCGRSNSDSTVMFLALGAQVKLTSGNTSRVIRKPALHSAADQHLCFHYIDSTVTLRGAHWPSG